MTRIMAISGDLSWAVCSTAYPIVAQYNLWDNANKYKINDANVIIIIIFEQLFKQWEYSISGTIGRMCM